MSLLVARRFVGGPLAGASVNVAEGTSIVRGPATVFDDELLVIRPGWPQDREYVRVRRRSGEIVFEWHRKGWLSPNVRAIRAAVSGAD